MKSLGNLLKVLPKIDKMLSGIVLTSRNVTAKKAAQTIDALIMLKECILCGRSLHREMKSFENAGNELLNAISEHVVNAEMDAMLSDIESLLTDSTKYSKSIAEMRHQECFAVRSGVNGLLDICRKSYIESLEEIDLVTHIPFSYCSIFIMISSWPMNTQIYCKRQGTKPHFSPPCTLCYL